MTKLSINVNKIATLRNTRAIGIPDVVHAARLCLDAGAHGITVHPRPDHRHIRPADVYDLADLLRRYPGAELNIEGNPFYEYMGYVRDVRPTQCTLVPDEPDAPTSNHGWSLDGDAARLRPVIETIRGLGCRVSLFMDADAGAMARAGAAGVERVELYTEPYASAFAGGRGEAAIRPFAEAARAADKAGLGVNAGHDLSLRNLPLFLASVPGVLEVSIGHALVADALEWGLPETVRRYLAAIQG
jgi:pyridoxine 5-phosphate synthase